MKPKIKKQTLVLLTAVQQLPCIQPSKMKRGKKNITLIYWGIHRKMSNRYNKLRVKWYFFRGYTNFFTRKIAKVKGNNHSPHKT